MTRANTQAFEDVDADDRSAVARATEEIGRRTQAALARAQELRERGSSILATLLFALAAAAPASGDVVSGGVHAKRFRTSMQVSTSCGRRVEEGDIPYARFKDRNGRRPWVRVCVRDRDGRYCLPRQRPPRRRGVLYQPVLYKNTGQQVTTWRVVPEPE